MKFVNQRINPAALWSAGLFSTCPLPDTDIREQYGDAEIGKEIEKLQSMYMFEESIDGGNDEARLCLKSNGDGMMGACEDLEQYVEVLFQKEKKHKAAKLRVSLHFAALDVMIGQGGRSYFERCWSQDVVEEAIEVCSTEHNGTSHDSVLTDLKDGAMKGVFEAIANAQSQ